LFYTVDERPDDLATFRFGGDREYFRNAPRRRPRRKPLKPPSARLAYRRYRSPIGPSEVGKGRTRNDLATAQPRQPRLAQLTVGSLTHRSNDAVMLRPCKKRCATSTTHGRHDATEFMYVEPAEAQFHRPDNAKQPSVGKHRKPVEWNQQRTVNVLRGGEQILICDSLRNCDGRLDRS
jgi:hypothetical protein